MRHYITHNHIIMENKIKIQSSTRYSPPNNVFLP